MINDDNKKIKNRNYVIQHHVITFQTIQANNKELIPLPKEFGIDMSIVLYNGGRLL